MINVNILKDDTIVFSSGILTPFKLKLPETISSKDGILDYVKVLGKSTAVLSGSILIYTQPNIGAIEKIQKYLKQEK